MIRDADDFSTAPIDASEDEDLGEEAVTEPTTVTIGTASGTVEVTVTEDDPTTAARPTEVL